MLQQAGGLFMGKGEEQLFQLPLPAAVPGTRNDSHLKNNFNRIFPDGDLRGKKKSSWPGYR